MPSLGGLPEVPCARCGQRVRGLSWGDLCAECRAVRRRRAGRIARRVALGATLLSAAYVAWRLPADPTGRYYAVLAVAVTYILVRRIVERVAMELMK